MKIIIIGTYLSGFGGTEAVLAKWQKNLGRYLSCSITLILTDKSENTDWLAGYDYLFLNEQAIRQEQHYDVFPKLWTARKLKRKYKIDLMNQRLTKALQDIQPDIVVCISYSLLSRLGQVKNTAGLSFMLYYWDHMAYTVLLQNDIKYRKAIQVAEGYLCISQGIYQATRQIIGNKNVARHCKTVHLIHNPIERKKRQISITSPPIRFIYMGRLIAEGQKQVRDIFDAVTRLRHHDFVLDIYGDGIDRYKLEEYGRQHGILDKVRFHGWKHNAWDAINQASCLLLASNFEGLPMVIAEALSYGVPCISSNCPTGPSDMIKDGLNGFLFKPNDIDALAYHMLEFIRGEACFNQATIQQSIKFMYEESYFSNLRNIFSSLMQEDLPKNTMQPIADLALHGSGHSQDRLLTPILTKS
ncbi:glycosyltransferase [Alkanindiges sp. WGS2144]|uniref:glycosyltransferase n=1 Tax=Alkanindiges sp. WGS2144 TaxID=3366808 RepID=UPI00375060C8